jgi:hypothetical protein
MIDVLRVPVSKNGLRAMSQRERSLFLLLGFAANQITLLSKLVIFSTNKTPDGVEQSLSGAQSQMLARLLIGVLHEAWELIRRQFLESKIGKDYQPRLDAGGREALERLKKHFGGSNVLAKLRNNYVFHHPYDVKMMDAAFESAATDPAWDGEWNWFFSHSNFNSFYFMSDVVALHGIMNAVGETDLVAAQTKIMGDVSQVSQDMTQFIMALTAALWIRHFGPEMTGEVCAKIEAAPGVFDVWIPFFVEVPVEEPLSRMAPSSTVHSENYKRSFAGALLARSRRRIR